MKKPVYISFFLILFFFNSYSQTFTIVNSGLPDVYAGYAAWGDYDNDNDLDVLICGSSSGSKITKIYKNNGIDSFAVTSFTATGISDGIVSWCDYDNDGDLDFLISGDQNYNNFVTKIYRNNGNTFIGSASGLVSCGYGSANWFDYNKDGLQDIFLSGNSYTSGYIARVYKNNGNNTFSDIKANLYGVSNSSSSIGDFNNDSFIDFFYSGTGYISNNQSFLYSNNNGNSFNNINTNFPNLYYSSTAWGDYDNDGDLDVFLTGVIDTNYYSKLYKNEGNFVFSEVNTNIDGVAYGISKWADIDNDGDLDIIVSGYGNNGDYFSIFRNEGLNTFTNINQAFIQIYVTSIEPADYDNDGDLDILITGVDSNSSGKTILYKNEFLNSNNKPNPPASSYYTQIDNKEIISWLPGTDIETPQSNLNYNIRIGTTLNGINKVSPMSDLSSGFKKIPNTGNVQEDTTFMIKNLAVGKYYYNVQTVDNELEGSVFSTTDSFFVSLNAIIKASHNLSCSNSPTQIEYEGNAITTANYNWNFDGGIITSGTGQGPYLIQWADTGMKTISLFVTQDTLITDTAYFQIYIENCFVNDSLDFDMHDMRVTSADFDNDNDLDFFVIGTDNANYNNVARIYFSNSDGTFYPIDIIDDYSVDDITNFNVGDYNHDGFIDVLLYYSNYSSQNSSIKIIKNNGYNNFSVIIPSMPVLEYGCAEWADYDNDGDLDIYLSGRVDTKGYSFIYQNEGNDNFKNIDTDIVGFYESNAKWGDLNNDNYADLIISGRRENYPSDITYIYKNNCNGTFTLVFNQRLVSFETSIDLGDYDNDEDNDIIITGHNGEIYMTLLYINQGNFNFIEKNLNINSGDFSYARTTAIKWGDYDSDGLLDFLCSSYDLSNSISQIKLFLNEGNENFTNINANFPTSDLKNISLADLNNDSNLDVIVYPNSYSYNPIYYYINNFENNNTPPNSPQNTSYNQIGSKINISWNPSSDNETPQNGLTYNIGIGTTKNDMNILSPLADLTTGKRKLSSIGNAFLDTTYVINNLSMGWYYYKIQTIDNSYVGSLFSNIDSFFVNPTSIFELASDTICLENTLLITYKGNVDSIGSYTWDFDGGNIIYGTGQGPYYIQWADTGFKEISLSVSYNGYYSDTTKHYVFVDDFSTNCNYDYLPDINVQLQGLYKSSVAWGDYDNDNDLDLAITGFDETSDVFKLYRNDLNNIFTEITTIIPGVENGCLKWCDFNNDNNLDIFVSGLSNSTSITKLYKNNGDGTFTYQNYNFIGQSNSSSAIGDLNNDGLQDIVVNGSAGVKVYLNVDGNTFQLITTSIPLFYYYGSCELGDYDNDGDLDILINGGNTKIYKNDNLIFTDINANFYSGSNGNASWSDYDNDGDLDILLITKSGYISAKTLIFRNDGNNIFTNIQLNIQGVRSGSAIWGDYDNDGDLDFFLNGIDDYKLYSLIYRNDNNDNFTKLNTGIEALYQGKAAWGDYDNDNDLDLIISGFDGNNGVTKIYNNSYPTQNTKPEIPVGLSYTNTNNSIIFSWNKSHDAQTSQNSLTYNLLISDSLSIVKSSMSDTINGFRKIADFGNSQFDTTYTFILANFSVGTKLHYKVQAIDNSFISSSFSVTDSLTIPLTAGFSLNETGCTSNSVTLTYTGTAPDSATFSWNFDGATVISGSGKGPYIVKWTSVGLKIPTLLVFYNNEYSNLYIDSIYISPCISQLTTNIPAVNNGSSDWGDYDNDGDLDLIITGQDKNYAYITKIFRNDGSAYFTDINANLTGVSEGNAAWGDYDNDNDLDLLVTGYTGSQTIAKIYKNNNGVFSNLSASLLGLNYGTCSWGDYNNDGYLDILMNGRNSTSYNYFTKLYKNNKNSTFTEVNTGIENYSKFVVFKDINNDGWLDIILSKSYDDSILVYKNIGDETFSMIPNIIVGFNYDNFAIFDFDTDGDNDIIVYGKLNNTDSEYYTFFYANNGSGIFTLNSSVNSGINSNSIQYGDYDNDGDYDVLLGGKILNNVFGNYYLTNLTNIPSTYYTSFSKFADYDNDGDLDFIFSTLYSTYQNNSVIFNNNSLSSNNQPSPPVNLICSQDNNILKVKWSAGNDIETPQQSLTYNINIQKSGITNCTLSSMSDLSNGYHRIVNEGNTKSDTVLYIYNLDTGKYYVNVQSIDGGFKGSIFSYTDSINIILTENKNIDLINENISIYPNPNNGNFILEIENAGNKAISLHIFDISGRNVFNEKFENRAVLKENINVSSLESGIYLVKISDGSRDFYKRVLIND